MTGPITRTVLFFAAFLSMVACQSTRQGSTSDPPGPTITKQTSKKGAPEPVKRPTGKLSLDQAEQYMLDLINHDRAANQLDPVAWDSTAARAGRVHVEDMVRNGYTAHWGTDGSTPEFRYTEVGGQHMVQENAGCFADGKSREMDPKPQFTAEGIEKVEAAFMNERPPHDGHRKNILRPSHTHVGVGLSKAQGIDVVCMAQEFVDIYGEYDSLPTKAKAGQKIKVQGKVNPPAKFVGVGIARTAGLASKTPTELLHTGTYPIPAPFVTYFPKGYVTPKPVEVKDGHFEIEVPLTDGGKPGVYEVSIWGELPGSKDFVMVSLRTIDVRP